jgi:hypothetical protein
MRGSFDLHRAIPSLIVTIAALAVGPSAALATECANEKVRDESMLNSATSHPYDLGLPECRAYEQVTPPSKGGVQTSATAGPGGGTTDIAAVAVADQAVLVVTPAIWGQPPGYTPLTADPGTPAEYDMSRTDTGWSATALNPSAANFVVADSRFAGDAEPGSGIWAAKSAAQSQNAGDLYVRNAAGVFLSIGPIAPESVTAGVPGTNGLGESLEESQVMGASADLTHVLFAIRGTETSYDWPGDETELSLGGERSSLYEYVGAGHTGTGSDVPTLVGVDNNGAQISQCGTLLGAHEFGIGETGTAHNAVSADGTAVFFTAEAGECVEGARGPVAAQLYARIGEPGHGTEVGHATTVNVAGSSECATSDACNVTIAPTYQGAANDGSEVFFTSSQALTSTDKDSTADLYECAVPGDAGSTPTPTSKINPCPSLIDLSAGGAGDATPGEGADVQKVVAISEDGSHVYFTAQGVLTTTANNQGHAAESGDENLYVVNTETGKTAFVATLPEAPSETQTTPDGLYLAFTSVGDLTTDDASGAAQVFRYDAQTAQLVRVSVGQAGFDSNGNTATEPATLAFLSTISDDGAYVAFQSNTALTPQVQGGTQNVYLWHEGTISLISDGHTQEKVAREQGLVGIDATGQNLFFVTPAPLVAQDKDELSDLYDARIGGGFPAPVAEPSCAGEECQGPLSKPLPLLSPGSTGAPSNGNLVAPAFKAIEEATEGSVKITKHSSKSLSVSTPGAGKLTLSKSGLATVKKSAAKAGAYTLAVTLTSRERKLLAKHKSVTLAVKVEFVPSSGKSSTATVDVTIKKTKPKKAKSKGTVKKKKG